ncbi:MAG: type II toxin-antitoxin system RelE/ParE family toxin [bacterium]|nr:type II toxin-antitoxin system RelE/ParE family toxin [bacterium]
MLNLQFKMNLSSCFTQVSYSRTPPESQAKGLGIKFLDEVDRAINTILQFPEAWSPYTNETRRFLLHRFPFAIVYRHTNDKIQVFAIMHLHRKPNYWKGRQF